MEGVKVVENTHHLWKAMDLADVEELKDLHLKTEGGVDHQYDLNVSQHRIRIQIRRIHEKKQKYMIQR